MKKHHTYSEKAALHAKKRRERYAHWTPIRVTTFMKRHARTRAWRRLEEV
jgi:hypothetical protein